jgi:hypothetical protein
LAEAKKHARVVKPERLGCLGPVVEGWPRNYAKVTGTYEGKAARGNQHAEIPFVIEAYAEIDDRAGFQIAVNRTPITGSVKASH